MEQQQADSISVATRSTTGKGAARKLRAQQQVPCVAYGTSNPPMHFTLDPKTFIAQMRKFGKSHIYTIRVDGRSTFKALIKDVQSDAFTRSLLHVDFHAIDMNKALRIEVPIELTGKPIGFLDGGLLTQILRTVEVQCLPDHIPTKIVADVTPLAVGASLHLSDLVLPEGVKFTAITDQAVAAVVEPESAAATPVAAPVAAAAPAAGKTPAKTPDKK